MVQKVNDTFTDSDGTALTAHTPEQGSSWSAISGSGTLEIRTNRLNGTASGSDYYVNGTAHDANEIATIHFTRLSNITNHGIGVVLRDTTSGSLNHYLFRVGRTSITVRHSILENIAGSLTELSFATSNLTGTDYTLTVEANGSALSYKLSSGIVAAGTTTLTSTTNSDITAGGKTGVVHIQAATTTTGMKILDFTSSDDSTTVDASATMTRDTLTMSGKAVTATGQRNESASLAADTLTVSGKAVTATAGISVTATMTADVVAVSGKTVTATAGTGASATMTADAVPVSGKSVTGTAGTSAAMTVGAATVTGQAVTGSASSVIDATATMTAATATTTGRSVAATGQRNESASLTADSVAATGHDVTATGQRNESATVGAASLTVSGQSVTGDDIPAATGIMSRGTVTVTGHPVTGIGEASAAATVDHDILIVVGQLIHGYVIPSSLDASRVSTVPPLSSGSRDDTGIAATGSRIVTSEILASGGVLTPVGSSGARTATIPDTIHAGRSEGTE